MKQPERINKIIERVLGTLNLKSRLEIYPILEKWPELVGERIASHTRAIGIDGENLLVAVDNHLWQAQLYLMKDRIMKKIECMGIRLKNIKFIIDNLNTNKKEKL